MKTIIIILFTAITCIGQGVPYTIILDTTRNVTGFTTSDSSMNFYIVKENLGDRCIKSLLAEQDLSTRSLAVESIVSKYDSIHNKMALTLRLAEYKTELVQDILSETERSLSIERAVRIDAQGKNKLWEYEYKRAKRQTFWKALGTFLGGAGLGILVTTLK